MKSIVEFIFRIWGWKLVNGLPEDLKKCVVVMAPHTSMWDFVIGKLAWTILKLDVKFLIKKEMFFFPLGGIIKKMGGIPVDRSKSGRLVEQIADHFEQNESFYITITPEGTRSLNANWKRGFYFIALKAEVPVALAYLDYKKKLAGIGPIFTPCGDYTKDFKVLEEFYKGVGARHPEKFNLS